MKTDLKSSLKKANSTFNWEPRWEALDVSSQLKIQNGIRAWRAEANIYRCLSKANSNRDSSNLLSSSSPCPPSPPFSPHLSQKRKVWSRLSSGIKYNFISFIPSQICFLQLTSFLPNWTRWSFFFFLPLKEEINVHFWKRALKKWNASIWRIKENGIRTLKRIAEVLIQIFQFFVCSTPQF